MPSRALRMRHSRMVSDALGSFFTAGGRRRRQPARPRTGRPVRWDAVDIYRVTDDGKISEQWAFEDFAAILSQVGAVSLPWAS